MDISIPGAALAIIMLVIVGGFIGLIFVMRSVYKKRMEQGIAGEFREDAVNSPLESRAKYKKVDVFTLSGTFFNVGMALAIGLAVLAFGWTQYEDQIFIPEGGLELDDEIVQEIPRTAEPPPPPPPPPPPVIEEVPEEELLEEEEQTFTSQDVFEEEDSPPAPVAEAAPPPPPPPPPPPAPKVEEIFKVVEQMPLFPGCADLGSKAERDACHQEKLLKFIYKNIKYPAIARENGVEGTVVVTFVVEKDGTVTGASVVRDIGAQTGEESLRVVELMNKQGIKWTPGKQRGRPVRVQFNLPVRFKLQ